MKFRGKKLNEDFDVTEADSPMDLYKMLKSNDDPPIEAIHCWVFMESNASTAVWADIPLSIPGYFEKVAELAYFREDGVLVEFRDKKSPAPKSSPNASPTKDSDVHTEAAQFLDLTTSFSSLGLTETLSSPRSLWSVLGGTPPKAKIVDFADLINANDPFTKEDIANVKDPLYLRFPDTKSSDPETICVSSSSFESFVRTEAKEGRNVTQLEMKAVTCKTGHNRDFILSKYV